MTSRMTNQQTKLQEIIVKLIVGPSSLFTLPRECVSPLTDDTYSLPLPSALPDITLIFHTPRQKSWRRFIGMFIGRSLKWMIPFLTEINTLHQKN